MVDLMEGSKLGVIARQQLIDLSRGVHAAANVCDALGHQRLQHLLPLLVRAFIIEHARLHACTHPPQYIAAWAYH